MRSLVLVAFTLAATIAYADPAWTPSSFGVEVAGSGRPVILIPGLGCPGDVWDQTVRHLHAEAHVLTLAGFAGRAPIATPLLATVRTELARYIREHHLDHPVVIGHSLGGMIAIALAEDEPGLVGPTIVVDASPVFEPDATPRARAIDAAAQRDQLLAASDAERVRQIRAMFATMTNDPRRLAPIVDEVVRSDRASFAAALYDVIVADFRPGLARIRAPVLFVLSETSPRGATERAIAAIPRHRLRVVPNTRHFVMIDDPAGFFAAIDPFLAAP
ncbi:MAG TPA: alpha/beta hydrolase [Kofleriaceae bacterium]|nr:alpha/beta hydrolase [Kofleriaceae bacterium]